MINIEMLIKQLHLLNNEMNLSRDQSDFEGLRNLCFLSAKLIDYGRRVYGLYFDRYLIQEGGL